MTYLAIAAALALFVWSLKRLRAIERATAAIATARTAVGTLLDPGLGDDEKERVARASSVQLFRYSGSIALRLAFAVAIPAIFLASLVYSRLLQTPTLVNALESWEVLLASTIAVGAVLLWKR